MCKDVKIADAPGGRVATARRRHGTGDEGRRRGRRGGATVGERQQQQARGGTGTVVMTVKVVVTRKEAEKLIARLNVKEQRSARERKARMAELTGQLRAGDSGASSTTHRLPPIQEI